MRIRGERECKACGTRWSYYETGAIDCPSCGSIRSVGVDEERKRHTDAPASIDLSGVMARVEEAPIHELTDAAKDACGEYVRSRGFITAGELRALDDAYLAVAELRHVADVVGRSFDPTETEELYLLDLIRGADAGERPDVDAVPESIREARGLAYASAVGDYRREMRDWLADQDREDVQDVSTIADRIDQEVRRVEALSGDVDPAVVERLVEAVRDLATYLTEDDETALATARNRLDRLA